MPRPLRIEFEGAWHHVMNRGAAQQDIFKHNQHRNIFLNLLREASLYYNVQCHAYCLMNNHYHLLLHTPQSNLSIGMRHINGVYTQKFNRSEKIDGPLFRGRYKAILIEEDAYLLHVSRYIHLNPVEAKIIDNPEEYQWSSYAAYIGNYQAQPWLQTDFILDTFKTNKSYQYKLFVNEGLDQTTKKFYELKKQPSIMGKLSFIKHQLDILPEIKIMHSKPDYNRTLKLPSINEISTICSNYFNIKEETLLHYQSGKRNMPRKLAMYLSRVLGQAKLEDVAYYFQCKSKSGASNAVSTIKKMLTTDSTLRKQVNEIESLLYERGQVYP